jgi:hypothetical protein
MSRHSRDREFFRLLSSSEPAASVDKAPATLKSRVYSALIREQQKSGPLKSLSESEASGYELCAWENLMAAAPIGKKAHRLFHCHACHARLLAEHFESPPIAWAHCPYVDFKKS